MEQDEKAGPCPKGLTIETDTRKIAEGGKWRWGKQQKNMQIGSVCILRLTGTSSTNLANGKCSHVCIGLQLNSQILMGLARQPQEVPEEMFIPFPCRKGAGG